MPPPATWTPTVTPGGPSVTPGPSWTPTPSIVDAERIEPIPMHTNPPDGGRIVVLDVTDSSEPVGLSRYTSERDQYQSVQLDMDRQRAYVTGNSGQLLVFDIATPGWIGRLAAGMVNGPRHGARAFDIQLYGGWLYLAAGAEGLLILKHFEPGDPRPTLRPTPTATATLTATATARATSTPTPQDLYLPRLIHHAR